MVAKMSDISALIGLGDHRLPRVAARTSDKVACPVHVCVLCVATGTAPELLSASVVLRYRSAGGAFPGRVARIDGVQDNTVLLGQLFNSRQRLAVAPRRDALTKLF